MVGIRNRLEFYSQQAGSLMLWGKESYLTEQGLIAPGTKTFHIVSVP